MTVEFPYQDVPDLEIDDSFQVDTFAPLAPPKEGNHRDIVKSALENPIGAARLRELAIGRSSVLIVFDDYSRPTPIYVFVEAILEELQSAGIEDNMITFMAALGTHRPMTAEEFSAKLGQPVVDRFRVLNHTWDDLSKLEYLGETEQGVPVWINPIVRESDLVIGLGAIMPLEVAGFTGGGKILVPGLSGELTVDEMHWNRIDVPAHQVVGKRDNPIRKSIDGLARKAGLDFIVNVVLDDGRNIVDAVAGDMVEAHRVGCRRAEHLFAVQVQKLYDIVIADSYPFDVEFWQANKALDTAGAFVRTGGVIVLVSPCYEGWSRTHSADILEFGYRPVKEIKELVASGRIRHKVVGVHMYQVSQATDDKRQLIMVSSGIPKGEIEKVGFRWAASPQAAFDAAVLELGRHATVAVLKDSPRIMAIAD